MLEVPQGSTLAGALPRGAQSSVAHGQHRAQQVRSHWGQGDLETSGNILGKLWALDHFSPNVFTNHILGTFRL